MLKGPALNRAPIVLAMALLPLLGCDDVTTPRIGRRLSVDRDNQPVELPRGTFQKRMGVIAPRTTIYASPSATARPLGTLVAGNVVARADSPVTGEGCAQGYYAIEPRGYLCLDETTTLDDTHPTLLARAMPANRGASLPYPYAMTRREASLYEPDPQHKDGVRERRKLAKGSFFAVVGTWNTLDDYDQPRHLAMLTTGRFVAVQDIEAVTYSRSPGVLLDGSQFRLPLAFKTQPNEGAVNLSGRSKLVEQERCWSELTEGCLRESEAVVLRAPQELPSFAKGTQHWATLDLTRGALLLYEGPKAVFATLLVRLPLSAPRAQTTYLRSKLLTGTSAGSRAPSSGERLDLAWVLELTTGMSVRAATTITAYRERYDENAVELHPEDAKRLFDWLTPTLPDTWHGITTTEPERESSPVVVQ